MSFDSLTLVFHKNGHFHTLELTDQLVDDWSTTSPEWLANKGVAWIDGSGVRRVAFCLVNAGYEIVSAVVRYDGYREEEMVTESHKPGTDEVTDFYSLLQENEYSTGSILAYTHCNGFGYGTSWNNAVKFEGDSKAELAQEWFNIYEMPSLYKDVGKFHSDYQQLDSLPYVLSIDWEDTLDNIIASVDNFVEYLNGTYYMFSE
jgi:hypothetical protein